MVRTRSANRCHRSCGARRPRTSTSASQTSGGNADIALCHRPLLSPVTPLAPALPGPCVPNAPGVPAPIFVLWAPIRSRPIRAGRHCSAIGELCSICRIRPGLPCYWQPLQDPLPQASHKRCGRYWWNRRFHSGLDGEDFPYCGRCRSSVSPISVARRPILSKPICRPLHGDTSIVLVATTFPPSTTSNRTPGASAA